MKKGNLSCLEAGDAAGAQGWSVQYPAVSAKKPLNPTKAQNKLKKTPNQTRMYVSSNI